MTIADEARDSAVPCELVLYAYRKNKDGVVVSFVVHPDEVPAALATARIGSRWVGALVHIGDDERPIKQKEVVPNQGLVPSGPNNARPQPPSQVSAGAKREWRALPYSQQAGIRINEPTFTAYLREEHPDEWHETQDADDCLKFICNITSKRELQTNHKAALLWHQVDTEYQAWLARERVGA